jgi:hypothetical protein
MTMYYVQPPNPTQRERVRRILKSFIHPRPETSRLVWTTKRGVQMRISAMQDSHLCNTLRILERKAFLNTTAIWSMDPPQGEYAQLAYEEELSKINPFDAAVATTPRHPLYPALVMEAEWRGLTWKDSRTPDWAQYFDKIETGEPK